MVAVPTTNMAETTAFPRFKCFTDRENEYLRGNVKKVVWHFDNGSSYEMEFNEQGNYSKITYRPLSGMGFPAHFGNRHHRYFYEGYVVNNYFDNLFLIGFKESDFHNPFWLDGIVGGNGSISFSYDASGRLTTISATYRFHSQIQTDNYEYVYDDAGHLITRKCNGLPMMKIRWSGDNITGIYTYNENGTQKRGYDFTFSGNVITLSGGDHVTIKTNSEGKIISYEKRYTSQIATTNLYYNEKGLIGNITDILNDIGRGTNTWTTSFKYDSHKNITECGNTMYEYTYDSFGNWTKKQTYTISRGDIEVKHKEGNPETREITYY